jgi:hypothetical protein
MIVLLIDIDSKPQYGNLALKKIEKYHRQSGDDVIWNLPLWSTCADKIYVSCLFKQNKCKAETWQNWGSKVLIGGTGYDLSVKLPPEIEEVKIFENFGFTTRGCPRRCWFCVVPQKEGDIHVVGDIYDFWDRNSRKIVILDNNILTLPDHFLKIAHQIKINNLHVDFNQGLDMRLLTPALIKALQGLRRKQYRFSWDGNEDRTDLLKKIHRWFGRAFIYVLVGHLPFERDLEKLNIIKSIGHNAYAMRLEKIRKERRYIRLAQWTSLQWSFFKYTFEEFTDFKDRRIIP